MKANHAIVPCWASADNEQQGIKKNSEPVSKINSKSKIELSEK